MTFAPGIILRRYGRPGSRAAECVQNDVSAAEKNTLSFKQRNKQFVNDTESSKCPPPAFARAFNLCLNVDGKITCSVCLSLATNFSFGENLQ